MQNFQGVEIWIVAAIAFVLGFLVQWLFARSRKNALVRDYESQLQSSQRTIKRTQDDLETVRGQLDAQRDRAEVLAAERANAKSELEQAVEANAGSDEKLSELAAALEQEVERREAAEGLLEQTRTQAMDLQTSLEAARSELAEKDVRLGDEVDTRAAAETALEAEALRVSRLAQELETLSADLVAARAEIEAAVALQPAWRGEISAPDISETDQDGETAPDKAVGEGSPVSASLQEAVEQPVVEQAGAEETALAAAQKRVVELNESVTALSAMGAELAVEFEKRERENQELRAEIASLVTSRAAPAGHTEEMPAVEGASAERESVSERRAGDIVLDVEEYQQMTAAMAQVSARASELEEQLDDETAAAMTMRTELDAARAEIEELAAEVDRLRRDRDALTSQLSGMQARLNERTEEVNALTSATVAAAATLKRRDDALREAEELAESLRAQISGAGEEASTARAVQAEKDAQIAEYEKDLDELRARVASLTQATQAPAARGEESVLPAGAPSEPPTDVDVDAGKSPVKEAAIRGALAAGVTPAEIDTPQDLERLPGIGPRYERMLYDAGIGTFWEFANCPDESLLAALGLENTQRIRAKADEARAEARRLAEETDTVGVLLGIA